MAEKEQPPSTEEPNIETVYVDWSSEPTPAFVNFVAVNSTPNEVGVLACDILPFVPQGRLGEGKPYAARIAASLRWTHIGFFKAVATLASHWNKMAVGYAKAGQKLPRFKIVDGEPGMQLEGLDEVTE